MEEKNESDERIKNPLRHKLLENELSNILAYVLDNDPVARAEFVHLWIEKEVPPLGNLDEWKEYRIKREVCVEEGRLDLVLFRNSVRKFVIEVKRPGESPDEKGWERLKNYLDSETPVGLLCDKPEDESEIPEEISHNERFRRRKTWGNVIRMLKIRLEREYLLPTPRVSMWCREIITYVEDIMKEKMPLRQTLDIRDLQVIGFPYYQAREVVWSLLDVAVRPLINKKNWQSVHRQEGYGHLGLILKSKSPGARDSLSVFMGIMPGGEIEGIPDLYFFIEAKPESETWNQIHEKVAKCVENQDFPRKEGWLYYPTKDTEYQIIERTRSMIHFLPKENQQEKVKEWFKYCIERIEQTKILQGFIGEI